MLRRDQIWFTEKDEQIAATDLFSLYDFSVRKEAKVEKGYLIGRYGTIPFIRDGCKMARGNIEKCDQWHRKIKPVILIQDCFFGEGMYGGNGVKESLTMKIIFLDIDGVLQPCP